MNTHIKATRQTFLPTAPRGWQWVIYLLFLLGAPGSVAGYAAYLTAYTYTHYGPVAAIYRPRPFWLAAALLSVAALALSIRAHWRRRTRLILTPSGITWHHPPAKPLTLTWKEIKGVAVRLRQTWPGKSISGHIVLHLRHGERVRLSGFAPHMLTLAQHLQRYWYAHHLPHLRQTWQAGEQLDFGALRLGAQGLTIKSTFYPWRQVQWVALRDGHLMIKLKTHTRPLKIPLRRVYNPEALIWWLHEEARR